MCIHLLACLPGLRVCIHLPAWVVCVVCIHLPACLPGLHVCMHSPACLGCVCAFTYLPACLGCMCAFRKYEDLAAVRVSLEVELSRMRHEYETDEILVVGLRQQVGGWGGG